ALIRAAMVESDRPNSGQLAANIRHGDSLLGPDAPGGFDWHAEFPEVMAAGGVDVVIGHPPLAAYSGRHPAGLPAWVRPRYSPPFASSSGRHAADLPEWMRAYYSQHYSCRGWITAHGLFVERAARDLSKGLCAWVLPDQVGHLDGYGPVREQLAATCPIVEVQ